MADSEPGRSKPRGRESHEACVSICPPWPGFVPGRGGKHHPNFRTPATRGENLMKLSSRRVAGLAGIVLVVGLGAALPSLVSGSAKTSRPTAAVSRVALDAPGEGDLTKAERYWYTRLTYPTGRFDQR